MTEFQTGILALVRAGLTESAPVLPGVMDYQRAFTLAEKQQLVPLIYYGALQDPAFFTNPLMQLFMERSCAYIAHSSEQEELVASVCEAFSRNGVDHMPLKGTLLKKLYPAPEMRVMGDSDILIRMEDYPRIEKIMLDLGLHPGKESDHEYNWFSESGLQIELHKRLVPSYNKDYYAYYGDGWRLAKPSAEDPHAFEMTPEDTFIYMFTHFAKHYRDSGVGMKYVLDFYVYRSKNPDLDEEYIKKELKALCLYDFYRNIRHTLDVWFGDMPTDEMTDYLTSKLFEDGVFGRQELNVVSEGVKLSKKGGSAKARKKWGMVFPSYATMSLRYPVLKKCAILLPIFWIVRLFDLLFNHKDRVRRGLDRADSLNDEAISAYQQELNYVGLDFNFGEKDPPKPPSGEE